MKRLPRWSSHTYHYKLTVSARKHCRGPAKLVVLNKEGEERKKQTVKFPLFSVNSLASGSFSILDDGMSSLNVETPKGSGFVLSLGVARVLRTRDYWGV